MHKLNQVIAISTLTESLEVIYKQKVYLLVLCNPTTEYGRGVPIVPDNNQRHVFVYLIFYILATPKVIEGSQLLKVCTHADLIALPH